MSENICSRSRDKLLSETTFEPWVSNSLSACPLSAQSLFYSRSSVMTWWGREGNFPLHANAIFALTELSQLWSQLLFTALGATPGCSFRLVARCRWAEESGSLVLDALHTVDALIAQSAGAFRRKKLPFLFLCPCACSWLLPILRISVFKAHSTTSGSY